MVIAKWCRATEVQLDSKRRIAAPLRVEIGNLPYEVDTPKRSFKMQKPLTYALLLAATLGLAACGDKSEDKKVEQAAGSAAQPAQSIGDAAKQAGAAVEQKAAEVTEKTAEAVKDAGAAVEEKAAEVQQDAAKAAEEAGKAAQEQKQQ